jgi:hypothetical protein
MTNDLIVTCFEGTITTMEIINTFFRDSNELIDTFLGEQVTRKKIIINFGVGQ